MDALGNYIGGEFRLPAAAHDEIISRSPADANDVIGHFPLSASDVDRAVEAARGAFRAWSSLTQTERSAAVFRIRAELLKREEAFTELIGREIGKPRWEARAELKAM